MAETIENNVRRLIIDEMAVNPKYYEKMSQLLDALILQRKREALDYKAYLERIVALAKEVKQPDTTSYPTSINTPARRALFDTLRTVPDLVSRLVPRKQVAEGTDDPAEAAAGRIDRAILAVRKDGWRGNTFKEREVRNAIRSVLAGADGLVESIFELARNQRDY